MLSVRVLYTFFGVHDYICGQAYCRSCAVVVDRQLFLTDSPHRGRSPTVDQSQRGMGFGIKHRIQYATGSRVVNVNEFQSLELRDGQLNQ